jgi:ssDNA-binding Zn-finger/Zn-ribbon topoisomerase 1
MGKELKTSYSCIQCQKGFHVNSFTAFHYRGVLSTKLNALLDVVFDSDRHPTAGHPSKYAPTSTMHMKLPAEKETIFPRALVRKKSNVTANAKRKRNNAELRNKRRMEKKYYRFIDVE